MLAYEDRSLQSKALKLPNRCGLKQQDYLDHSVGHIWPLPFCFAT